MKTMKAIDCHAHFLPPQIIERVRQQPNRFPYVEIEDIPEGTVRFRIGSESWTRPVSPALMNLRDRSKELAGQNIYMQLNAGWLDIFGYNLPKEEGAEWSRFLNETLLEAVGQENGEVQYASLATVPLQDGELAASEVKAAKAAGHRGVMIGTWVPSGDSGYDLDHPSLSPFWQAAADLDFPVFLHPVFAGTQPRAKEWGMVNAVARPNETAISLARILYAGIPQRFPGLKLIISHGGGALPFIIGRLQRNYTILSKTDPEVYNPLEGFQQLYFDSVVFEPEVLRFLLTMAEADKILLGSDAPFPIRDPYPRAVVESEKLQLSDEVRSAILAGNAQKLFHI
jgi:aminocarboxymuconate-semialdehyde decarboxylase